MQAGPDGKLERFLTGLQRGAKTTLFALHLTEGVAGAYGEVSVGSTRPRVADQIGERVPGFADSALHQRRYRQIPAGEVAQGPVILARLSKGPLCELEDRKSTRLNSSHANISYAVFCLKKKKNQITA